MTVARIPLERLSAQLRDRRQRLVGYAQRNREGWSADLEAYDRDLLAAAAMLEVAAPQSSVLPLSAPDRASLEQGLAERGLEVRTDVI